MFCNQCGKSLAATARFCDGCGASLDSPPTATASVSGGGAAGAAPARAAAGVAISKQVAEEVKARSRDAWEGLKVFAKSPVGGLPQSFAMFNERRAMQVGVVFAIAYVAAVFAGIYLLGSKAAGMVGFSIPLGDLTAAQFIKVLILGFVPFGSLVGAGAVARTVFRGKGTFAGDVYTAGASLLPMGVFVLAAALLGVANIEVIAVLLLFALTYTILMLYAGCSRIAGVSEAGAAPAVPIMLLISGWLTKVILVALW